MGGKIILIVIILIVLSLVVLVIISNKKHDKKTGFLEIKKAIKRKNHEWIKDFLKTGFDINSVDSLGKTFLEIAIDNSDPISVKIALEKGASPNLYLEKKLYPLEHAILKKNLEIVKVLLQYGANCNGLNIPYLKTKTKCDIDLETITKRPIYLASKLRDKSIFNCLKEKICTDYNIAPNLFKTAQIKNIICFNHLTPKIIENAKKEYMDSTSKYISNILITDKEDLNNKSIFDLPKLSMACNTCNEVIENFSVLNFFDNKVLFCSKCNSYFTSIIFLNDLEYFKQTKEGLSNLGFQFASIILPEVGMGYSNYGNCGNCNTEILYPQSKIGRICPKCGVVFKEAKKFI